MGRGNIFKGVKSIDFYHRFNSEEPYYEYLSEIKWKDDYVCKKCENIHYCKGRLSYSRHCTRCKYDESPTARTMFDKCKFSIEQTFHIAFKISTKKKGMSSLELSEEYGLRQKTCWEFKWKIQQAMQSSKNSKRLLNYILCIRFFIEVHSIVSASRFFHMPTYLRVVIECQSRFFPFFPAFSRNCPDYFLHTSGSSSFRSLSDLGAR